MPFAPGAIAEHMALDEALLEAAERPTLRLYGVGEPSLTLGVLQGHAAIPAGARARPWTRRVTGGGAVLHGVGDVTVSVVMAAGDPRLGRNVAASYARFNRALALALARAGHVVTDDPTLPSPTARAAFDCFAARTNLDLSQGATKIAGSAERRRRGRLLWQAAIRVESPALVATLPGAWEEVLECTLVPGAVGAAELELAETLARTRYRARAWLERR